MLIHPGVFASTSLTATAGLDSSYDPLTRHNAALLLIDYQVGPLWEPESADARRRVTELARVARGLGVPTILTTIAPERWGPIIPELAAECAGSPLIVRHSVNAWEDPRVRAAVQSTDRTKLIVAGSAAEVGVALFALAARDAGYDVYAPADASGQFSHRVVLRLSQAGVIVTTASLVATELTDDPTDVEVRPPRASLPAGTTAEE